MFIRVAALLLLFLVPLSARAEQRIALLIGNKDYKPSVGALVNPLNDVRLVSAALSNVGFEILATLQNAGRTGAEVLTSELAVSQASGKRYRVDQEQQSMVSGKTGHRRNL
jgi:uncharacterized caspase-like protein